MERLRFWEGVEWQEYVQLLLKRYYGPGFYVEVPDKHEGDYGIEGFSRDGCAYQCYAAEEPLSTDQLYEKQREKITADVNKFIKNGKKLIECFGPTKISKWILVVPRHDSAQILRHAEKKAQIVRNANLPYVDEEFYVHVITDKHFAVEIEALRQVQLSEIHYVPLDIEETAIEEWTGKGDNSQQVRNLNGKLLKLPTLQDPKIRTDFSLKMTKYYIEGQNTLSFLLNNYPEVYEVVAKCKAGREHFLEMESFIHTGDNIELLSNIIRKYKEEIKQQVRGVSNQTAEVLTYESVSDWLMRCPLDFPGVI